MMRSTRWRGSTVRCPRRSRTTSSSCARTSTWRRAGRARPSRCSSSCRAIESLAGFVAYNLGIALLQDGRPQEAIEQLDKAGQLPASDPAGLAIRDKSNLVLGTILFESGNFERAKQSLDRVRLEGPFSNQALLRAGWAEASAKQYDRALVPWNILVEREPTDAAVQEAMLAVPHAYASLNLHGRAAIMYGRALELFSNQIERVDASIGSIREGRFLKALIREESREDETWVIRLRSLPDAPETYYLMELMASHDFQTALHNYLDLEDLRSRAHRRGRPASMLSTISSGCADRTTSRCCRRSMRSSASWIRGCACDSSSASTSPSACRRC